MTQEEQSKVVDDIISKILVILNDEDMLRSATVSNLSSLLACLYTKCPTGGVGYDAAYEDELSKSLEEFAQGLIEAHRERQQLEAAEKQPKAAKKRAASKGKSSK